MRAIAPSAAASPASATATCPSRWGESKEEHPYYAPSANTAAALSVLLLELLHGRLEREWVEQVQRQREYAQRFSFSGIAQGHLALYRRVLKKDA